MKIKIKCLQGESLMCSLDRARFDVECEIINKYRKANKHKGFFGFIMEQVAALNYKKAQLELLRELLNEQANTGN